MFKKYKKEIIVVQISKATRCSDRLALTRMQTARTLSSLYAKCAYELDKLAVLLLLLPV